MVASVWCLAAAVFVNVYCSVLISYLSTQYKLPEVNSLADLAESDFHIGTIQGTISEFDIMVTRSDSVQPIYFYQIVFCSDVQITTSQDSC